MPRKINDAGINLIKGFEELKLKAYKCPAGVWTIGYGHTSDVQQGDVITEEQALEMFEDDLQDFSRAVEKLVKVPLTDNQFAALVSLCFNIGVENFRKSTLLEMLNAGNYAAVPTQLMRWVYSKRLKLAGLVRRRSAEGKLWQS